MKKLFIQSLLIQLFTQRTFFFMLFLVVSFIIKVSIVEACALPPLAHTFVGAGEGPGYSPVPGVFITYTGIGEALLSLQPLDLANIHIVGDEVLMNGHIVGAPLSSLPSPTTVIGASFHLEVQQISVSVNNDLYIFSDTGDMMASLHD